MRFNILSDIDWESRVDQTLAALAKLGYFEFFGERDYGEDLQGITIIFMCQDPALNFKQRIRLSKKEKKLYMDIMLDLPMMKESSPMQRQRIIAERLYDEVPKIVSKYKLDKFDTEKFVADLRAWLSSINWL